MENKNNNDYNAQQFVMRIGKTTYVIGMHFKKDAKETMDNKVRKMIRVEIISKTNVKPG